MFLKSKAQQILWIMLGVAFCSLLISGVWLKAMSARCSHSCELNMRFLSSMLSDFYHDRGTYPDSWEALSEFYVDQKRDSDLVIERLWCPYQHFQSRFSRTPITSGPILANPILYHELDQVLAFCDHGRKVILALNGSRIRIITKKEFIEKCHAYPPKMRQGRTPSYALPVTCKRAGVGGGP